ncbi:hypothetical protein [Actinoplanes auranticolor]|uniref:Uncharacterized protein n=1 Tax=Actinoplanes auranticolor TaxID=47988 RepID=A0A919VJX5_9ACTN|nr:hypothetical protein [Actinoplanes auranticolor]GIM65409.1 hypothetical protein Aau02nite_16860 [Actinoplanes auranticolor]
MLTVTPNGRHTLDEFHRLADALRDWSPEEIAVLSAPLQRFASDLLTRTDRNLEVAR